MIKKIKTKSNQYWLIDHKKTFDNILIGDSVILTRQSLDDYYFSENIQLIKEDRIELFEEPTNNEVLFFEYAKKMKEVPNVNLITEDFNIKKYLIK